MKQLVIIVLVLFHVQALANMANPVYEGTLGSSPFVSQFVDVIHEDILIKIEDDFESANFQVKYQINSSKDGQQIPFLFYASEYADGFSVRIDGQEVGIQDFNYDFGVPENSKFKDFSYFFENSSRDRLDSVLREDCEKAGFYVSLRNMIYFEADIPKGEHVIEVNYTATRWIDSRGWMNKYSFRYALSPAKYWKSFGTLQIQIDATSFDQEITSNLGIPFNGDLSEISEWKFDQLPTEIVQINYHPKMSPFAQLLIKISPLGLAILTGLFLTFIHWLILVWYRKRNLLKRFSIVVTVGSILVPLLFLVVWMNYYDFIDSILGDHAARHHGYTFFALVLYPILLPFYWLFSWYIDKRVKRKLEANLNHS